MKRILLTGAGGAASQNFLASLRLADESYHVIGVDVNPLHLACAAVDARYVIPRCDEPGYLPALRALVDRERIDMVHPQPDAEVRCIAEHRDQLEVRTFLPATATILRCQDKAICHTRLKSARVPVPESYRLEDERHLPILIAELLARAGKVWVRAVRGAGSRAALPIETVRQAREWIHYWTSFRSFAPSDFMVSEYLPGREYAFQSVWYEGELITSMARERMEYMFANQMPSGQSSSPSIARTVHKEAVNEIGIKAVMAVSERPHGIFCVDMKENVDGVPSVTEINAGRFFTTSNFFAEAGSNMPDYYLRLAFGESVPELPRVNAVEAGLYWVRGVDREPRIIKGNSWAAQSFAA